MKKSFILILLLAIPVMGEVVDGSLHWEDAWIIDSFLSGNGLEVLVGIGTDYDIAPHPFFMIQFPGDYLGSDDVYTLLNSNPDDLEKIAWVVGAVAGLTRGTSWTSSYVFVMFEDYVVSISTADARWAIQEGLSDQESGIRLLSSLLIFEM